MTADVFNSATAAIDTAAIVRRFHEARRDGDLVVLQGFHALKHALRFGRRSSWWRAPIRESSHGLSRPWPPS